MQSKDLTASRGNALSVPRAAYIAAVFLILCASMAGQLSRALADTLTWTGAGDGTTFGQAANWSPAVKPFRTYDCIIPAGAGAIRIGENVQVRSLSTARNVFLDGCVTLNIRAGMTLFSGAIITVDNSSGCPALVFQGGTQSIEGSGQIVVSSIGNYNTILTLTNQASLTIGSGITLTYAANSGGQGASLAVGNGCALTNFGTITIAKPGAEVTIEGNGTFTNRGKLNIQAGTLVVYQLKDEAGQILVSPGAAARLSGNSFTASEPITIPGGADLQIGGDFTVAAPIDLVGAHLRLEGNWINSSQITSLQSKAELVGDWTSSGTLHITDSDLAIGGFSPDIGAHQFTDVRLTYTDRLPDGIILTADSSTGDITLDSVVLSNATLRTHDDTKFVFHSTPYHRFSTTLSACRLEGEFAIGVCTYVFVDGGLTLIDGTRFVLGDGCLEGLYFEGLPQSISGSGEFIAAGPDEFGLGLYYMFTVHSELTMESGITFRVPPSAVALGTRKIVVEGGRFINRGAILMQAPGGDFAIVGVRFENQGLIESAAGQVRIYPWNFDNMKAGNILTGGTWRAINAPISFDEATIQGIAPGTDVTLVGPLGTIPQFTDLSSNAGTLHIRSRSQSITPGTPGLFTNSGTLDLSPDSAFAVTGAALFTPSSSFRTQVAGLITGQSGRFTATGSITLGGKLQGSFESPYTPIDGDITTPVIQGPQITGAFASHCFDPNSFDLGVQPVFAAGPPSTLSLEVSHSTGIPPQFVHGPVNTSANPNATLYVDAQPANLSYQWNLNGEQLIDGPTGAGSFISGATTSKLTILRVQPSDVGQYAVTVSTPCAAATSNPALLRYCNGDFNSDLVVDDADFIYFVSNYNILDCSDPTMPPTCPGDFNFDGLVDDADFSIFVVAYNALICP